MNDRPLGVAGRKEHFANCDERHDDVEEQRDARANKDGRVLRRGGMPESGRLASTDPGSDHRSSVLYPDRRCAVGNREIY